MKLGANNMKWQYGTKNDASDDVSGGYQILPGTPSTTSPLPHTTRRTFHCLLTFLLRLCSFAPVKRLDSVSIDGSFLPHPRHCCFGYKVASSNTVFFKLVGPWTPSRPPYFTEPHPYCSVGKTKQNKTENVRVDHWGDLDVDGRIILEWISRRWDLGIWTGLGWPRIETGGGRLWVR